MNNLNICKTSCLSSKVLVLGCGNVLFGDDGFGPAAVSLLQEQGGIPDGVWLEDVGTGVRDLLFDMMLSQVRPRMIIILDAARKAGRRPGEVFEMNVGDFEAEKCNDFSVHHFPSINLLKELAEAGGVEVKVIAVQAADIPDEVRPGLSKEVQAALHDACHLVRGIIRACSAVRGS